MTEIRHHGGVITGARSRGVGRSVDQESVGEAYEDFISSIYVTAIRLGTPTRGGLRTGGDLSDEAITVGTRELVARGLLATTEDPDAWDVVPPRDALPRYADAVERRMETTRATAAEVDALWRRSVGDQPPQVPSGVELLAGVDAIAYRIAHRHRTATRRVWWAIDSSPAGRQLLAEVASEPGRLLVRDGVERRLVVDTALLGSETALSHVDRSRAAGAAVGVANGLPFSALVSDSTAAIVDLSSIDPDGSGSFEVRLASPVRAVARMLEVIWGLSTPYGPDLGEALGKAERLPLGERDQRILALLTTGASDKVIARQTGVSVRTVERRVRYLMDHLGAATRFQAGVQAVRRGWI